MQTDNEKNWESMRVVQMSNMFAFIIMVVRVIHWQPITMQSTVSQFLRLWNISKSGSEYWKLFLALHNDNATRS